MGSKRRLARANKVRTEGATADPREIMTVLDREAAKGERLTAREILDEGHTAAKTSELAANASGWLEKLIREVHEKFPAPIACRRGCSFCCHIAVSTGVPHVVAIARYMVEKFTEEELADARRRVAEYCEAWSAVPMRDRFVSRLRCPLLVGGECSVYPIRPLTCQGWNSLDVSRCEAFHDDPRGLGTTQIHPFQLLVSQAVERGLDQGLQAHNLDSRAVDFVPALRIALDVPDATERWLAGEDVFRDARPPKDDPEYQEAIKEAAAVNMMANAGPNLVTIGPTLTR